MTALVPTRQHKQTQQRHRTRHQHYCIEYRSRHVTGDNIHVFDATLKGLQATPLYNTKDFFGACLDSGATESVTGLQHTQAYSGRTGHTLHLRPSPTKYKFGDGEKQCIRSVHVRIPIPNNRHIPIDIDIADADIPMLLGMDVMKSHRLLLKLGSLTVFSQQEQWTFPMHAHHGHIFIQWPPSSICFTHPGLHRLHLHLFHHTTNMLFQLIRSTCLNKATERNQKLLPTYYPPARTAGSSPPQLYTSAPPFLRTK